MSNKILHYQRISYYILWNEVYVAYSCLIRSAIK